MNKHTEPYEIDGVWNAANACRRCGLWLPGWMTPIPIEYKQEYCWGHRWAVIHLPGGYPTCTYGPFLSEAEAYKYLNDEIGDLAGIVVEMQHV